MIKLNSSNAISIKTTLKKTVKSLLCYTILPFNKLNKNWLGNKSGVFVLLLHNISIDEIDLCKELLVRLKNKYDFIDVEDFKCLINGEFKASKNHLLLTFDDGLISNYRVATEVLAPLNIKAIFFVPSGFIDAKTPDAQQMYIKKNLCNNNLHIDAMRAMSWENLSELVDRGHTIGSHTKNHLRLSEIYDDILLKEEIISSGNSIETIIGIKVEHFAFPFGDIKSINKKALDIARLRYKYVYSGVRGANRYEINPLAIRRESLNISDGITYNTFVANGGLSLYYWRARRRLNEIAK